MSTRGTRFLLLSFSLAILFSACSSLGFHRGGAEEEGSMATLGGLKVSEGTQNSAEIQNLARFAIDEHNKKENAVLEFARVVEAKEQVVAGTLHHLTLEAIDAGKKKLYEAKVWVKPWLDFKELQEFKHAGDLDGKRDEHEPGLHTAPVHDPVIQDAANHAVKTIQQRSNSLFPYELLEILHAKTEVIANVPKFDLLLKLKRGTKEENYKVEVHKKEGTFHLNQMQLEHAETASASVSE